MLGRREFLQSMVPALLQRPAARPNFLVIVSDDQGIGDVGCYGAQDIKTPNLDRLAAGGIRFTDWHANSPVCSPSRASLLTGRYPQRAGIPQILFSKPGFDVPGLRAGENTLATELRKLGYRTSAIGKWHLGSSPESQPLAQGFEEFLGYYSGWIDYYSHRFYTLGGQPVYHDLWRNEQEIWREPQYMTEMLGREARAYVERQNREHPFFLYLAFGAPHYPMMAPQTYLERFPASMDRDRRLHAAMVAALDDAIGSVLSTLAARGLDNTVVFFMSDNGATQEERADHRGRIYHGGSNGQYRGAKGSLFEGGTRVPAMLSWPGAIAPGQVRDECGIAMDILPTFVQWAGGTPPAHVDGSSLSAALLGKSAWPQRDLFWAYDGQFAIRRAQWKLIQNYRERLGDDLRQQPWLSNLTQDPSEKRNFESAPGTPMPELAKRLESWRSTLQ
jgi:arylsulfatase A-like enzyme